jgi:hypothetical protein
MKRALDTILAPPLVPNPAKCWIQTLQGHAFDLLNPTPDMVDFDTIATVLARVPRFGGHTTGRGILSVAQHCEQGAWAILRDTGRRDWAAAFLLHDGHETYIGDIPTPVRNALVHIAGLHSCFARNVVIDAISELKWRIDAAIYTRAGIPWPLDSETADVVKVYDIRMLRTERDARLSVPPHAWGAVYERAEPLQGVDCGPWGEELAARMYSVAARELLPS